MKRSTLFAAVAAVLCLGLSAGAFAAEKATMKTQAAKPKDILGAWELVAIKADDPAEKVGPANQRWVFQKDGVMRHIGSENPITPADVEANAALPANTEYTLKGGVLKMTYKEPATTMSMRCLVVKKILPGHGKEEPEKAGDLILQAYRTGSKKPDVQWVLRKV